MKKQLLLTALLFFSSKLFAQQFNAEEFQKKLGKKETLCDTVRSFKIVNDTLSFLYMGAAYPHQRYTILIRDNKIVLDWTKLTGKTVCVTGVFEMYQNQPQIPVAEPEMITVEN